MNGIATVIAGILLVSLLAGMGWIWNGHIEKFDFYRDIAVENCRSLQSIEALLRDQAPDFERCRRK